eukprot:Sdes_comp20386_c0_seq1m14297
MSRNFGNTSFSGVYSSSSLLKSIKKATNSELVVPKRKHLNFILDASRTSDSSVVSNICDQLFHRITSKDSWINALKSLIVFHHLMRDGAKAVLDHMSHSRFSFRLRDYMDKKNPLGYEMSLFIRKYSAYLEEKIAVYVNLGHDFVREAHGFNGKYLHERAVEGTLLHVLECIQNQIDALLAVDIQARDLSNPCVLNAFSLLLKDMIKLFVALNDSVIHILERYFELGVNEVRLAFNLYRRFCDETGKITAFLDVARTARFAERTEIPDLKHVTIFYFRTFPILKSTNPRFSTRHPSLFCDPSKIICSL